jgi:hypothetical protein
VLADHSSSRVVANHNPDAETSLLRVTPFFGAHALVTEHARGRVEVLQTRGGLNLRLSVPQAEPRGKSAVLSSLFDTLCKRCKQRKRDFGPRGAVGSGGSFGAGVYARRVATLRVYSPPISPLFLRSSLPRRTDASPSPAASRNSSGLDREPFGNSLVEIFCGLQIHRDFLGKVNRFSRSVALLRLASK